MELSRVYTYIVCMPMPNLLLCRDMAMPSDPQTNPYAGFGNQETVTKDNRARSGS